MRFEHTRPPPHRNQNTCLLLYRRYPFRSFCPSISLRSLMRFRLTVDSVSNLDGRLANKRCHAPSRHSGVNLSAMIDINLWDTELAREIWGTYITWHISLGKLDILDKNFSDGDLSIHAMAMQLHSAIHHTCSVFTQTPPSSLIALRLSRLVSKHRCTHAR